MRRSVHGPPARSGNTPPPHFVYIPPDGRPLDLLYQDDELILINKPAGLLSVPGKRPEHQDCVESRLSNQGIAATLVHRLDMDTSGIMVLAKNKKAHRHLGLQFERRQVSKHYIAVVDGIPDDDCGIIDMPLRTDWPNRPKQMVDFCLGRPAITHWKVLERNSESSRLMLSPVTGRSHQLRVHLNEMGHPILGDRFYGSGNIGYGISRLLLHAQSIELFHPSDGRRCKFECYCPF